MIDVSSDDDVTAEIYQDLLRDALYLYSSYLKPIKCKLYSYFDLFLIMVQQAVTAQSIDYIIFF